MNQRPFYRLLIVALGAFLLLLVAELNPPEEREEWFQLQPHSTNIDLERLLPRG